MKSRFSAQSDDDHGAKAPTIVKFISHTQIVTCATCFAIRVRSVDAALIANPTTQRTPTKSV